MIYFGLFGSGVNEGGLDSNCDFEHQGLWKWASSFVVILCLQSSDWRCWARSRRRLDIIYIYTYCPDCSVLSVGHLTQVWLVSPFGIFVFVFSSSKNTQGNELKGLKMFFFLFVDMMKKDDVFLCFPYVAIFDWDVHAFKSIVSAFKVLFE